MSADGKLYTTVISYPLYPNYYLCSSQKKSKASVTVSSEWAVTVAGPHYLGSVPRTSRGEEIHHSFMEGKMVQTLKESQSYNLSAEVSESLLSKY